jgi:hypothetical protein
VTIDQLFLEEMAAYLSAFFEKEAEETDYTALLANLGYERRERREDREEVRKREEEGRGGNRGKKKRREG